MNFTHDAAKRQLDLIARLAGKLGNAPFTVEHHHVSKSIQLPVPTITLPGLTFMLRDNFHDLNMYVKSAPVINLPLSFFYKPKAFAWYTETIASNRGYTFSDWTDEEMNDPRILRVKRKNGNGYSEVDGDEKDRWTARGSSTDWYAQDWSSGQLITTGPTPFTEATTFYIARRAFGEGIPRQPQPYSGPCTEFMNACDEWDELTRTCLGIAEHVKAYEH